MHIIKVEVGEFRAPFRDGPYAMSHVTQHAVHGRLICVHTDNGHCGLGEIPLSPYVLDEERRYRESQESEYLGGLVGQPVESLVDVAKHMSESAGLWGGLACFALETAFLDLQAQRRNHSLADQLGGRRCDSVDDYFSISERSVQRVVDRLNLAGPDRSVIQLKLGVDSLGDDIEQIGACLNAMHSGQLLLADANGGWSVDESLEVMARFDDPRIYWEEPCNEYNRNVEVAAKSGKPVMVDQCVAKPDVALRAIDENVVDAICIKPPFLGGLLVAKNIRDACASAGIKMRIDGPWCGDIATAAMLHLAVGAPPELLIAGCDLREPLLIDNNLSGAIHSEDGRVSPPSGFGIGISSLGDMPVRVFN